MPEMAAELPPSEGSRDGLTAMSFLEHLEELRRRLIYAILAVTVGFFACWNYHEFIFSFVQRPIVDALQRNGMAEKLVYLTNIEGLRRDVADPSSLIRRISVDALASMLDDGALEGGMIPKVKSCVDAIRGGVTRAHILDGRAPHALLLEVFTDDGIGTMISTDGAAPTSIAVSTSSAKEIHA